MDLTTENSLKSNGFSKIPFGLIVVIVVLAVFSLASAAAGYRMYQKIKMLESEIKEQPDSDVYTALEGELAELEGLEEDSDDDEGLEAMLSELKNTETSAQTQENRNMSGGSIAWREKPQEIKSLGLFKPSEGEGKAETPSREKLAKYYSAGVFESGSYQDAEVILVSADWDGPSFYPSFYRFLRKGETIIALKRHSDDLFNADLNIAAFSINESLVISELSFPEILYGVQPRQILKRETWNTFFSLDELRKIFTHSQYGDVYTTEAGAEPGYSRPLAGNGFYLRAPDGTAVIYSLSPDFIAPDSVPDITWNDGAKNIQAYTYTDLGGCGSQNYISVVSENVIRRDIDLTKAGVNSADDSIYEFVNAYHPFLKDFYEKRYYAVEEKVDYRDFVIGHPVFFWIDPFDRLIKFERTSFLPAVECGKPVIYLYPEQTELVSVKISPKGGLRYTEPAYNGGWEVIARPNGRLTEIKTGAEYPYLFWEGRGGIYQTPEKGFVVEKKNVHKFLLEKLARLGLNSQEIKDFTEYWEPYMQKSPYYFITFLTGRMVDELAPLEIAPSPDTVIRILMDFEPLDEPREVEGYDIKTPKRRGFTVVEWGGVRR